MTCQAADGAKKAGALAASLLVAGVSLETAHGTGACAAWPASAADAYPAQSRAHCPPPTSFVSSRSPQSANALTFDQLQGLTYLQVKGTGIANTCPTLDSGSSNVKDLKPGTYKLGKFCMEPTSFTVKEESQVCPSGLACHPVGLAWCTRSLPCAAAHTPFQHPSNTPACRCPTALHESQFKGGDAEFVPTKLMTRLTYTLDEASWLGPRDLAAPVPCAGLHAACRTVLAARRCLWSQLLTRRPDADEWPVQG